jgi:hypothetical protein
VGMRDSMSVRRASESREVHPSILSVVRLGHVHGWPGAGVDRSCSRIIRGLGDSTLHAHPEETRRHILIVDELQGIQRRQPAQKLRQL